MGFCVLAAPEIVVGAVIVTGVVVVGFAIKEALDAYELSRRRPEARPVPETKPAPSQPLTERRPKPESAGPDWPPPLPPEPLDQERRPECKPRRVKHRGGNPLHNTCADRIPDNTFSGWDALVNGKNFDALQERTRTLWEVKTDNFDTYPPDLRSIVITDQVEELRSERALALACRFDFRVGVRSPAHKTELEFEAPDLKGLIVIMEWC